MDARSDFGGGYPILAECSFSEDDKAPRDLEQIAKRLFWWKSPAEALSDSAHFLAQVMTYGTVEDVLAAKRHFSDAAFREVLANPPAGVFDPRSWHYWHLVLGISPGPDLPKRQFSATPEQE